MSPIPAPVAVPTQHARQQSAKRQCVNRLGKRQSDAVHWRGLNAHRNSVRMMKPILIIGNTAAKLALTSLPLCVQPAPPAFAGCLTWNIQSCYA